MSKSDSHVDIRDVVFHRGDRIIFDGLNVSFPKGKITAIMGPSGTGKTTLLRLISGQLKAEAGQVKLEGQDVGEMSRSELLEMRKYKMGMLFQTSGLFTDLNVFENVAFPIRIHTDLPHSMIRDLVLMKLEAVGLRGARDLYPAELSGGMIRRVALARTIAMDPQLIM